MAEPFQFELILPGGSFFSGAIASLRAPAEKGEMTILSGHAPFLVRLLPGVMVIRLSDMSEKRLIVFSGFLDILPNKCVLLTEEILETGNFTREDLEEKIHKARAVVSSCATAEAFCVQDFSNRLRELEKIYVNIARESA